MLKAWLVDVADPRWPEFLARTRHDFYHLPGYAALSAKYEGGQASALLVADGDSQMLAPLVIRRIPQGGRDATSPYGYPGPLVLGTDDPTFLSDALHTGMRLLEDEGLVTVFLRLHPLLNRAPPSDIGTLVHHGETVVVDLTRSAEALWRGFRKSIRAAVARLGRAGYRVRFGGTDDYPTFKSLYRSTMIRRAASEYYLFDDAYLDQLRDSLTERLTVAVVELDGVVAAAVLLVETCGIVQSHLAGTHEERSPLAPIKLLDSASVFWAKDRGDQWLNLGGGLGGANDSIMEYKAGFSPDRMPFHTLRVVLAEQAYSELVTARDPSSDPSDHSGFFPQYRRPRAGYR